MKKITNNVFPCKENLLRGAVAAILGTSFTAGFMPVAMAQQAAPAAATVNKSDLDEVVVTGSRIVRRDLETNSPLMTIDKQQLEDNAFISVEQTLNELPQFMVGGAGMSGAAVTSLQGANGVDGGRGTGDMFNMSLLPDNAGMIGIVVPGAANVNLRGLGANRSLTLIDGHRAMPVNASMTVDLNSIPSIAIGGMEVITGGASAVYGADALAGVTNIKFRDKFEGMKVQLKSGVNEVGDGTEYQFGTLMGASLAEGKGHVMVGVEYSKREETLWNKRDFMKDVQNSPYSTSGDYLFAWDPSYTAGGPTGSLLLPQRAYQGNAPSQAAVNQVFGDRNCKDATGALLNCVGTSGGGALGFIFNDDGTLYGRSSSVTTGTGATAVTTFYGPQSYNSSQTATPGSPDEVTCTFAPGANAASGLASGGAFNGKSCNPTVNRVDYGRWLTSPRDAYNLFGRGTYKINDKLEAFADFHFASSNTSTRREPAPVSGGFGVVIPFHTTVGGDAVYLPSLILTPAAGQVVGQTRAEYLPGGTRGTSCAKSGGCLMSQAFPVSSELRTLLESRATSNLAATGVNPFRGLNACNDYLLATNPGAQGVQTNPTGGAQYIMNIDTNTGQPLSKCGPNSGWLLNQQLSFMPPRGTNNTEQLFQVAFGLRGDVGLSDWTWELYGSTGESETQTKYYGFLSQYAYQRILSAPNYGKGYSEQGVSSKYLTCTSGMSPWDPNLKVTQDCIDAIQSNQIDRNSMGQRIFELTSQGRVMNLPAGEMRGALGVSWRRNDYTYTPDSLREADYTTDTSAGQFASGSINEGVTVKEGFGELLVPLLKNKPLIKTLELELGARYSEYSTGQEVSTYKILGSWAPTDWMRLRGGYNRAERAPNMSELFATPSGSSQFASAPIDPCRAEPLNAVFFPGPTAGTTTNNTATTDAATRAKLQALCGAQINQWGGNNASDFHGDPNAWNTAGGSALIVGNPNLKNEKGDTWTMGVAFRSPSDRPLLRQISGTIDWYKAKVSDPIEVQTTGLIVNGCFNVNGLNPNFDLNDPKGYCSLIERDPVSGAIVRVYNNFGNNGELQIKGVDIGLRWSASMADMGISKLPGSLSISTNMNVLLNQIQRYGADKIDDYTGYGGASKIRANTAFTYSWARNRVSLTWNYRQATDVATGFAVTAAADGSTSPTLQKNPLQVGYDASNTFNLTAGTLIGPVNASLSVSNLLNTKPSPGGYDIRDPLKGYGTFSPFDDLVGRRYSVNLSMDF